MPIDIYDSANVLYFSTDALTHGCCVGTISAQPGFVNSKSFPSLQGMSLMALASVDGDLPGNLFVSYPGGVPTVTLNPDPGTMPNYVTLWAFGTRTIEPGSGVYTVAPDNGWQSIGPETSGLNLIGQAVFVGHTASTGNQNFGELGYSTLYIDCVNPPAVVSQLNPGEASAVMYVRPWPGIPGRWEIRARRVLPNVGNGEIPWHPLLLPQLFCYARKTYAADPDGSVILFDPDTNQISWSLGEPGLLYPRARLALNLNQSATIPSGFTRGVLGAPRGRTVTVDDGPGFPPEYHNDNFNTPFWYLQPDGVTLTCRLLREARTDPIPDQGSPAFSDVSSDALIINIGGL